MIVLFLHLCTGVIQGHLLLGNNMNYMYLITKSLNEVREFYVRALDMYIQFRMD